MKKSQFTEEQIAYALHEVEMETPVAELCRKLGVSEQTFYRWKKKFAGMGIAELRRLSNWKKRIASSSSWSPISRWISTCCRR